MRHVANCLFLSLVVTALVIAGADWNPPDLAALAGFYFGVVGCVAVPYCSCLVALRIWRALRRASR